jgi:CRISPR system Cascade subunit CasA
MPYDLRFEPWIPYRRRSGRLEWGGIALLADDLAGDPVVALAAPRPDFNGALTEFLIGMLSAGLVPADEKDWLESWRNPPEPGALETALRRLPLAFDLDGEGPRFLQDFTAADFVDQDASPIERLLFDSPGEQTLKLNQDLFVKRERAERLGRPAAAMALLTMQTYAPQGGSGHRTSLRGGGPLTTIVDPRVAASGNTADEQPLWEKIWANVETIQGWQKRGLPGHPTTPDGLFPWIVPTRRSDPKSGGTPTTPADGHPLQVYFGMPRRIRLEFGEAGVCGLTGLPDNRTVTGFKMRNYGIQYLAWRHPLSPRYRPRAEDEWLPMHAQPGGVAWKDWVGLTLEDAGEGREPATTVGQFQLRGRVLGTRLVRVHAFGVDFDNMKCRAWNDASVPLFVTVDADKLQLLNAAAKRLTGGGDLAAAMLVIHVKAVLFAKPKEAQGDFSEVKRRFWSETEPSFYEALGSLAANGSDEMTAMAEGHRFLAAMTGAALRIFDHWCPLEGAPPDLVRRIVKERYGLTGVFRGQSKTGVKLMKELGLSPPEKASGRKSVPAAQKEKPK